MFSYYGAKKRIVNLYPQPKYDIIIEPFAGASTYSWKYMDKSIVLNEKNIKVYTVWDWLIHSATKEEILAHREFYLGESIRDLDVCLPHKYLIGFCINQANTRPVFAVGKFACCQSNSNFASCAYYQLSQIAENLESIRRWSITCGDYKELENREATWFIDPPYQEGGSHYPDHDINYEELADWCLSRRGQIIVCEGGNAKWLDFKPLTVNYGATKTNHKSKKNLELVYTR